METSPPRRPPLDPVALGAASGDRWRVELLSSSPSTNAVVAARARDGEGEGLVVVTDHQTAGRGRMDRVWETPARSALTFSVLLTPRDVAAGRWPWLPLLTGVAVVAGVRRALGVTCRLKWPNDVLLPVHDGEPASVGGLKVAGILVERVDTSLGPAAVVGVGLNVSQTAAELPVPTAASLLAVTGVEPDRESLLAAVLAALGEQYDAWHGAGGDPAAVRPAYLAACDTVGREVKVLLPDGEPLRGTAVGVDADGRLEVDDAGRRRVLGAGDVVHVRPR